MLTGGKQGSKGFSITTDKEGNVTVTQGGNDETGRVPPGFLRTINEAGDTVDLAIEGSTPAKIAMEDRSRLNSAIAAGTVMLEVVESIVGRQAGNGLTALQADPALDGLLGLVMGNFGAKTQAQANLMAKIKQIEGKAFLEAFKTLKGGGQITEVEGIKATQAIARLERTQDLDAFSKGLFEFMDTVSLGIRNAQAQLAAVPQITTAPSEIENVDIPESFLTSGSIIKITKDAGITLEQLWNKMSEKQRLKYGE